MPTITDWLMVGITMVYVLATIAICWANIKSSNASREQLAESKSQFEETKRLAHRPYFSFFLSEDYCDSPSFEIIIDLCTRISETSTTYSFSLRIQNLGPDVAKGINCFCENGWEQFSLNDFPIRTALSHEKWELCASFSVPTLAEEESRQIVTKLHFEFSDLLENKYSQEFTLIFMQFPDSFGIMDQWTGEPTIIK